MDKISAIRQACKINTAALAETIRHFSEFGTERDFANFLNREIKKRGARPAFPTIVASGLHAFELHHKPCNKKIMRGFLLIDFGAKVAGYCSDMSRTFFVGRPSKLEIERYELVRKAQMACLSMLKPNILGSEIDHKAVLLLGKYAPNFIHAIGHGIDREVHGKPNIYSRSCDILKAGDVIAVEPGIYIKGKLGIRIEDDVLIKKNIECCNLVT